MSDIYVIGSMSIDLVVETERTPQKGETVLGKNFFTTPGGKGANQAVAASRLGQNVYMVGRIGDDDLGKQIYENLKSNGVLVENVEPVTHTKSGTAHITLADNDNSIIVVPAANNEMTVEFVTPILNKLNKGDIVLLQQEIPAETVAHVINYCYENEITSILNPAPYREISASLIDKVSYITPNETECMQLFGKQRDSALELYPNKLIVTVGSEGAQYHDGNEIIHVDGIKRDVIDTTGAGDTFNGALAVGLQKGWTLKEAIKLANVAASYAVTGLGAQGGMPTYKDVEGDLNV